MTKQKFLSDMKAKNLFNLPQIHHDFLAVSTEENDNIKEGKNYYYKPFKAWDCVEIRFFPKSKRVTVSKYTTK